jgi:hypothetical protein
LPHVARIFERLLEAYRHEGGGKWSGIELERATGGVVTRSDATDLRKRGIENLGMDKLWALASRRWVSPALWFEEAAKSRRKGKPEAQDGQLSLLETILRWFMKS